MKRIVMLGSVMLASAMLWAQPADLSLKDLNGKRAVLRDATANPAWHGLPAAGAKGKYSEDFEGAAFPPSGWSLAGSAALWVPVGRLQRLRQWQGLGSGRLFLT